MSTTTRYRHTITSYEEDLALFRTGVRRFWFGVLIMALLVAPLIGRAMAGDYAPYLLNLVGITAIVAIGLNFLVGAGGLVSLGHAGLVAIGAYTAGLLSTRLGFPFWMTLPMAGAFTGAVGLLLGLPALRLKGIYLAFATLAFQFIVLHVIRHWQSLTGGANGLAVPAPALGGFTFAQPVRFFYLTAPIALVLGLAMANLMRSRFGRALIAIRDSDTAAAAMGLNVARHKTLAFGISSAYAGIAGGLLAHFLGYIGPDHFTVLLSIEYLAIIILGGLGAILGSVLGAFVITLVPEVLRFVFDAARSPGLETLLPDVRALLIGLVLVLMLLFEPEGLAGRWRRIRRYWNTWPFHGR
jgi:branched-chain amino acid transport system permease protein